jgi:hypothetical protein
MCAWGDRGGEEPEIVLPVFEDPRLTPQVKSHYAQRVHANIDVNAATVEGKRS